MPIDATGLQQRLLELFEAPPPTAPACAQRWGQALQTCCAAVVPASTTVATASTALEQQLSAAFQSPNAIPGVETAFTAFGAAVGLGMAPAFTAAPPPGPVGFAAMLATNRATASGAAQDFSTAIVTWLKTGTATLNAPPATTVPWS